MDGTNRAKAPGVLDAAFKIITRRNSVYISFILLGALVGERVLDASTNKLWHYNNKGKMYEDIPVLGQKAVAEE